MKNMLKTSQKEWILLSINGISEPKPRYIRFFPKKLYEDYSKNIQIAYYATLPSTYAANS